MPVPAPAPVPHALPRGQITLAIAVLLALMFSKFVYLSSINTYLTFYLIERFHLSVQSAQLHLFAFLGAIALGTLAGGPLGDQFGRKYVIWGSILGVLPFTLMLPHAHAAADRHPHRRHRPHSLLRLFRHPRLRAGAAARPRRPRRRPVLRRRLRLAGLAAAGLGLLADHTSIATVYNLCAWLPALGLLTALLPSRSQLQPNEKPARMSLHGRTALVTGSTSGIGLGIAETLAAAGANLMLNGFGDADTIAALQNRLATTHGVRVRHHGADVSKPAECEALIAETATQLGAPAILVNNAGIQHTAPIEDFPTDRWDAIIAINLSSAFHTLKAAIPPMRAAGWGRIVNIASAHGLVASPYKSAYVAAKHGIVGLSKVAALELANTGITCNAICPAGH